MESKGGLAKTYWRALEGQRRKALVLVCFFVVSGLFEGLALTSIIPLLGPDGVRESGGFVSEWLLNAGVSEEQLPKLALIAFVILGLLSALLRFVATSRAVRLRTTVEALMRERMTKVLAGMSWSSFLSLRLGDVSQAVMLEGAHTGTGAFAFVQGVALGAVAVVFVGLALAISPLLTGLTIIFGFFGALSYRFAGKKAEERTREQAEEAAHIGGYVSDIFGNLKFFRSRGRIADATERARGAYDRYARASFLGQFYGALVHYVFESASFVFVGLVLAFSFLNEGTLAPESLVFLAIFYRLAPRLQTAQTNFQQARALRPWFATWSDRMETALANKDRSSSGQSPQFSRSIAFEDVHFSYPGAEQPILNGISWSMTKGSCVAFVGESGSGKTTLLDLVTGLLSPTQGAVLVDDCSLEELARFEWQKKIGMVMQDSPLFHASVLENIALDDPTPDQAKAEHCAEMANALDFIRAMPEGFSTVIGEKGGRLSGGQRQRLALARALYDDHWLLVLDEATSALDIVSEAVVLQALEKIKGTCSIVMVSHRLKTVEIADCIYVLGDGAIMQSGSWEALLRETAGPFASIASKQGLFSKS